MECMRKIKKISIQKIYGNNIIKIKIFIWDICR